MLHKQERPSHLSRVDVMAAKHLAGVIRRQEEGGSEKKEVRCSELMQKLGGDTMAASGGDHIPIETHGCQAWQEG